MKGYYINHSSKYKPFHKNIVPAIAAVTCEEVLVGMEHCSNPVFPVFSMQSDTLPKHDLCWNDQECSVLPPHPNRKQIHGHLYYLLEIKILFFWYFTITWPTCPWSITQWSWSYHDFDPFFILKFFRKFDRVHIPYIPAYSATPCIIRVKIWGLGWPEKRLPLCIIRPQILDVGSVPVGSVPGHLNVRHGYYLILLNSAVTPA